MASQAVPLPSMEFLATDLPAALAGCVSPADADLTLQLLVPGHAELQVHYLLSGGQVRTCPGLSAASDVTLAIQPAELEALSRGALDIAQAIALRRLQLFGSDPSIERLAHLLGQAGVVLP